MNHYLIATVVACGAVGMFAMMQQKSATPVAPPAAAPSPPPNFNEELARSLGADDFGMRHYVLVVLKSGPKPMEKGPERDAMFRGHFENMGRLSNEGKLVVAGPLDGVDGWRGIFILAVPEIGEAKALVATDPVVSSGEMVPEFHKLMSSAALMQVRTIHDTIAKKKM